MIKLILLLPVIATTFTLSVLALILQCTSIVALVLKMLDSPYVADATALEIIGMMTLGGIVFSVFGVLTGWLMFKLEYYA